MNYLYESADILNSPYEAFLFDTACEIFPIKPHWHYFVEIIYMIEGTSFVESNQKEYYVSEGDLILFHARDVHAIYAASSNPLKYLVLKFDINRLSINSSYTPKLSAILQFARKSEQADIVFPAHRLQNLPIRERFETCIREIDTKDYGYDVRIHGEISSLLIEMIRIWQADGLHIKELFSIGSETESSIQNITEYIDNHSNESLRVEELAAMCHMSYSHFAKCFKELYGRSCKDYIELIKIEKGEELLLFTDSSLSEISQETGFSDCSHFIKTFRKWKDITPGQYRLQQRRK
ncbi:MAG: AraC family transcriptional regulator [Lachnospiraceae bacterium]|nr:AraC family transcriptional regulator [Lachnospiraceae bacterium]